MIDTTFDIFSFHTVSPTYSWDEGTPYLPTGYNNLVTSISASRRTSLTNEEGTEYVGYAPFVLISLSSEPGTFSDSLLALKRTVDFGDYYNSQTNVDTRTTILSNESFCHVYVMPGLYTITYERTEYIQAQIEKFAGFGACLQKHCIDWSFVSLSGCSSRPGFSGVTWASTKPGGSYEKKWKFEPCEEVWANNNGLYIQSIGREPRLPLSWQWFNFLKDSSNPRNAAVPWLSSGFQDAEQLTWKESSGPCLDLRDIESVTWRWDLISCGTGTYTKSITWDDTKSTSPNNATWDYTSKNCYGTAFPILSTGTKTIIKKDFVRVLEIPPVAYLTAEQPTNRATPMKVRLSARNTIAGSFPIERIVWDLGDGSPLLVQRRWSNTLEEPFFYTGALDQDYQDPRNYDVEYTYTRNLTSASSFYPSITAYASSTNTSDCAATIVGPITYSYTDGSNFTLLQNELTDYGKVFLGQIDKNVSLWRAESKVTEVITIKYVYRFVDYYTSEQILVSNLSKLYYTTYSNSPVVKLLSGIVDVDKDGNVDLWQTDDAGTISWEMVIVHPYTHLQEYFADSSELINNETILYGGQGSGAVTISDLSGSGVDLDGDGNEDTWKTDNMGVISWVISIVHPYANLGYFTDTPELIKNSTKLYAGQYSSSPFVPEISGTADIDDDGNIDIWTTNNHGTINWNMVIVHPYQRAGYYSDVSVLINNSSVIWNGPGTGATILSSASGDGVDLDFDNNYDTWSTNVSGIISWTMTIFYPYLHFGYYSASQVLTSSKSKIFDNVGSGAYPIANRAGVDNIIGDGDDYSWVTDFGGTITFSLISAHPYSHVGYYSDEFSLINGTSVIYTRQGTAGIPVSGSSGTGDVDKDGNDDQWFTNNFGIISWAMISAHPYSHIGYYSNEDVLIEGFSKLWNGQGTGAQLIENSNGIADIDGDGNDDEWITSSSGIVTWTMRIVHKYAHFLPLTGYFSDDKTLVKNASILWNGMGTGATILDSVSGIADADRDGNDDSWVTNNLGVVSWVMVSAYPFYHFGYYSEDELLVNTVSILRNKQGTSAQVISSAQGVVDVDGDGNDDNWITNNLGIISWAMISAHPYYQFDSYYSDVPVLQNNNTSLMWTDQGTKGVRVISLSGIFDIDKDGNEDLWQTNYLGTISWYMVTAYQFRHFGSYFATVQTLSNNSTVLYYSQGTGAIKAAGVSGDSVDVDLDGNLDSWQTDNLGIVSWNPTVFYPYVHLSYYSIDQVLVSGTSVLKSTQYSGAVTITNVSGTDDLNGDGNLKDWNINNLGVISWTVIIVHPYANLGYYTDQEILENEVTIIYSTPYTGATIVSGVSSTADINRDGDLELWQTNEVGVVSWYTISAYPYYHFGYYSIDETLVNEVSELRNKFGTGATSIKNSTGTADVDRDGNDDAWSTNNNGIISWYMITAYPYPFFEYYADTETIIPGFTTIKYDKGTGATAAANLSGIADVNGDGIQERWATNENGIITISLYTPYPYFYFDYLYSDSSSLINGETVLYTDTTQAGIPAVNQNGIYDFDEDGNNEQWTTDANGIISWYTISAYPYEHLGYYSSSQTLISNNSVLRNGFGTGAIPVVGAAGIHDIDVDGNNDQWSTNAYGVISWYTITAHPFFHFGYYSDDETLISGQSRLWNGFGTGATLITSVSGTDLVDANIFFDEWYTDSNGVVTWTEIPVVGNYWYSTQTTSWYDLSNWKLDAGLISAVNTLPLSSTDVTIISGGLVPYVDIDNTKWIQPNSINAEGVGITFYSNLSVAVTCRLSGDPITFLGNSTFGV